MSRAGGVTRRWPEMVIYDVLGLGVRYGGRCVRCGASISRPWEMEAAILLRDQGSRKYAVSCAPCAGVRTKHRVGGGIGLRDELPRTLEVA
jgi:hypothetical protein